MIANDSVKAGMGQQLEQPSTTQPLPNTQSMPATLFNDEALTAQLIDALPTPVEIYDADGVLAFINQAGLQLKGMSDPSQAIGKHRIYTDQVVESQPALREAVRRAYHGEAVTQPDIWMTRLNPANGSDGEQQVETARVDVSLYPIFAQADKADAQAQPPAAGEVLTQPPAADDVQAQPPAAGEAQTQPPAPADAQAQPPVPADTPPPPAPADTSPPPPSGQQQRDIAYVVYVAFIRQVTRGKPELSQAMRHIEDHWRDEFDQEAVAKSVFLSVRQLHSLFKQQLGMTPREYHRKCKIDHIKESLADESLSISEAFSSCGEDGRGWIRKAFKQETGLSPKEYRASLRR